MRAELRAQHDAGAIIAYAYKIYAANFSALFALGLIAAPLQMLAVIAERRIANDVAAQNVAAWINLAGAFVSIVATAAVVHATHDVSGGARADFGRSLDGAFERLGALLTTALLFIFLLLASTVAAPLLGLYWLFRRDATIDGRRNWWLALIPGVLAVYLVVRWAFTVPATIIDGRRNWAALDRSAAVVRGRWWRTSGVILLISLAAAGPILIASISTLAPPLVEGMVTALAISLTLPFVATAQTLLYYDLKARNAVDLPPAGIDAPEPDVPGQSPRDV